MKHIVTLLAIMISMTACQKPAEVSPSAPTVPTSQWQLDTANSQLSYVSTKNKTIAENNTIQFASGQINSVFDVQLVLDMQTVETQIPIRNDRVKEHLFKTTEHATAEIGSKIPDKLPLNRPFEQPFSLRLMGQSHQYVAQVMVQKINEQMVVTTYDPILIHAKDFNLDTGIHTLLQLAGLQAISYEVPVDFKLVFNKIDHSNQTQE